MPATRNPAEPPRILETGLEPEFFVTDMRIEPAGGGNARVFAYANRRGVWHLLYTAIVPADALIRMGRQAMSAGADAHNMGQWQDMLDEDAAEN